MSLFHWGEFTSHSGWTLDYKIRCEHLTTADWDSIARLVAKRIKFSMVYGIPTGGTPFRNALIPYTSPKSETDDELVVDDVWTSGASMNEFKRSWSPHCGDMYGVVLFRRGPATVPSWVHPVFETNTFFGY